MSKKNKIVECYIYAKQLNNLCKELKENQSLTNDHFFISAFQLSRKLLSNCEELFKKKKINKLSFSILEQSIAHTTYFNEFNNNYKLLIRMMNRFNEYANQIQCYAN